MAGKHIDEEFIKGLMRKEVKKINGSLASYKRIKSYTIRDEELIKTSTKKIKRHLVKFQ